MTGNINRPIPANSPIRKPRLRTSARRQSTYPVRISEQDDAEPRPVRFRPNGAHLADTSRPSRLRARVRLGLPTPAFCGRRTKKKSFLSLTNAYVMVWEVNLVIISTSHSTPLSSYRTIPNQLGPKSPTPSAVYLLLRLKTIPWQSSICPCWSTLRYPS